MRKRASAFPEPSVQDICWTEIFIQARISFLPNQSLPFFFHSEDIVQHTRGPPAETKAPRTSKYTSLCIITPSLKMERRQRTPPPTCVDTRTKTPTCVHFLGLIHYTDMLMISGNAPPLRRRRRMSLLVRNAATARSCTEPFTLFMVCACFVVLNSARACVRRLASL